MPATLALQPIRLTAEALLEPLPFDLYSGSGTLLAREGARLHGVPLSHSLFRAQPESERNETAALRKLEALFARYSQLTESWRCATGDVSELVLLADELAELCAANSDVCVCMAGYLPGKGHAARHSFAAAIVALLLGGTMGWQRESLPTLARAAMTMNLSLLSNHDDWARSRGRLNDLQRVNLQRHPSLSADLLAHSPGVDLRWLTAVEQHHENLDGSGYPHRLAGEEIAPEARILRVADAWCALVLHRSGRGRKPPRQALRELAETSRGHFDHQVFTALKRLMGAYPPGTWIRLANRETALVYRWDRAGALPTAVLSVIAPSGELMRQFTVRNVRKFGSAIRDYTQLDLAQMSRLSWPRIWASG